MVTLFEDFIIEMVEREYQAALRAASMTNTPPIGALVTMNGNAVSTSPKSSPAFTVKFVTAEDFWK